MTKPYSKCHNKNGGTLLNLQASTIFLVFKKNEKRKSSWAFALQSYKFQALVRVFDVIWCSYVSHLHCVKTQWKSTYSRVFQAGLSIKASCHTVFEGARIWELELYNSNFRPATQGVKAVAWAWYGSKCATNPYESDNTLTSKSKRSMW